LPIVSRAFSTACPRSANAELGEVADVGAGDECLGPCAGEDDAPDRGVRLERGDGRVQVGDHLGVEGVELVRAVDRDGRDAVLYVHE
jgi:hypothetical protein